MDKETIKSILLAHGFTIKPGETDLKPYVYKAAFELLELAAPAVQGEPVGWQFYQDGKWWHGDDRIKDHRKNTEEAGFRVRDVYAAPQPAPDVAGLERALKSMVCGYMRLLQSGYDRITDLGGDCDPVDVMERDDAYLREARAALATYREKGGES